MFEYKLESYTRVTTLSLLASQAHLCRVSWCCEECCRHVMLVEARHQNYSPCQASRLGAPPSDDFPSSSPLHTTTLTPRYSSLIVESSSYQSFHLPWPAQKCTTFSITRSQTTPSPPIDKLWQLREIPASSFMVEVGMDSSSRTN